MVSKSTFDGILEIDNRTADHMQTTNALERLAGFTPLIQCIR